MTVKTTHSMTINAFAAEVIVMHYTEEQAKNHSGMSKETYQAIKNLADHFHHGAWVVKSGTYFGYCELKEEDDYVVNLEYKQTHPAKSVKEMSQTVINT